MVKKADIVLLIFIIVFGLSLLFAMLFIPKTQGTTLVVSINNEEYLRASLYENQTLLLPENTVIIKDGKAYVESSHCPDKVCINQGKISKKGETIICLPAKAVLEVE